MDIQGDHGDQNRQGDHDHGEQEVDADQRHHQTGTGDDLDQKQKEPSQRDEHRDAQADLLTRIAGQIENNHAQQRDADAGDDEENCVEKRLATKTQRECDVHERC